VLLLLFLGSGSNVRANDLTPKINVLSLLGEPLKAQIVFAGRIKTASIDRIESNELGVNDFDLKLGASSIDLATTRAIAEPIFKLFLRVEFADRKKVLQAVTVLLPLSKYKTETISKTPKQNNFTHKLLSEKLDRIKIRADIMEKELQLYKLTAAILAIVLLMLIWFGLSYRRKLLSANTKPFIASHKSQADNNDYLLEIANIYIKQDKFTEAEKLAQAVLRSGNNEQQKQAQQILAAKA